MNTSTADTSRVVRAKPSSLKVFFKSLLSVLKEIGPSKDVLDFIFYFLIPASSFILWICHFFNSCLLFIGIYFQGYIEEMDNFLLFTTYNLNFHLSVYGFIAFLLTKFAFKVKDKMKSFEET